MKTVFRCLMGALLTAALLMCFPSAPAAAGGADFLFDPLSGAITGYQGPGGDVTVPGEIGGLPVLRIGDNAFNGNRDITSITLPQSIRRIGHSAFYFCENLRSIELPEGLEVIMPYALFANEALESLTIPASVSYIGDYALSACHQLINISFLGEAPLLGPAAFDNGPQERQFTVPAEDMPAYEALLSAPVLAGGARAVFDRASDESGFLFDEASRTLTGYSGDDAYLIVPGQIGGQAVLAVGEKAFFGDKSIIRLSLPEGLETIGDQAFYASALVGLDLPDSLTSIGDQAFGASRLIALELPQGPLAIGDKAFESNALEALSLPEGIGELPAGAFARNRNLSAVYLPRSLQSLGAGAFADCDRLDYLVFAGRTMPSMAEDVFANCPIADIDIAWNADQAQVEEARAALSRAGLAMDDIYIWRANRADEPPYPSDAQFTFDEATGAVISYQGDAPEMTMYWNFRGGDNQLVDIRALAPGLFESSSIRRFFVPHSDRLEIIGDRAFANSQLEEIYLFDSVSDIGAAAFLGCENLTSIVIPASVERIGSGAFENCAALSEVIFLGGAPLIEADAFKGCAALTSLTLPAGTRLAGALGVDPQIVTIAAEADDAQLQTMAQALALPWYLSLRRAGEPDAFIRMPDMAGAEADFEFDPETGTLTKYIGKAPEVVVPRAIGGIPVVRVASLAFSDTSVASYLDGSAGSTGLVSVTLPETLRYIDDSAFLQSSSLKRLTCYGPIERLGIRAFENCAALETVAFINGIRDIDLYAFNLNESLMQLSLGNKLERIGAGAFNGCKALETFRVPASVTSIETGAFQGMESLKAICFDRPDVSILGFGNFQFSDDKTDFELCLPESATDEEAASFVSALNQNLLSGEEMVVRKDYK